MKHTMENALRHHRRGDLPRAERIYRRILRTNPRDPDALHLLGCIELGKNNRDQAVRLMSRAVELSPRVALYHENLAEAYHRSGDAGRAETECLLALRLDPKRPAAVNRLGVLALDRRDYEAARDRFSETLRLQPDHVEALVNMATALNRLGDYDLAIRSCELALRIRGDHPLAWNNLGQALRGLGKIAEAREAFGRAAAFPRARYNLGYLDLLEGNLREGLARAELRLEWNDPGAALRKPRWRGEDRPGARLLVVREQGMGDSILMARFLPVLLDRFAEVIVQVPEPLRRLMETVDPRIRVVTDPEGVDFDCRVATMSLPHCLGIETVDAIPLEPWIPRPGGRTMGGLSTMGIGATRPRIGINWAGNPDFAYDRVRSTSLDTLRPLLEIPGVEWVSLHKGVREEEAVRAGLPQPLAGARDFLDTAEVLAGLDLVISTETAVPNLSAAMGIPTCVLTAVDCDWRWRHWYPGVTICAQEVPGDWPGAVGKAVAAARTLLRDRRIAA